ncbi:hypothetical protein [Rhodovulum steppense]|uniref:Uncharacterized protein n=1 Tax=Rhodovulum steppense TaxID=540251 RepID=A0A4R1YV92_9RHOB|nr:hypothetical protein [Rhodovulum steppense]TCM85035.1 hypothetical protein EV216_109120 [Rhodovulum steppense]
MTPQRITIRIDALSVTGGPVSRAALERAIAGALAEALAGSAPLTPAPQARAGMAARAQADAGEAGIEPAIGRAVSGLARSVLEGTGP